MPETFLHGVELLEVDTGARPIRSVRSSVIGLVGCGIDDGTAASIEIGLLNAKLKFTATATGVAGNALKVEAVTPAGSNAALAVTLVGQIIRVSLATGAPAGVATSTASQVLAAINAYAPATALLGAALGTGSSGASLYAAHAATSLAGGVDASFPLNTPVLVTSSRDLDAKLGADSFLGKALEAIYTQSGAVVVVVRVGAGEDDATVAGDATEMTGVFALKRAQADIGYTPRILLAQYSGEGVDTTAAIKAVAESLRAVAVIGIDAVSATAATAWVTANGNDRTFAFWPTINGGEDPAPFIAGAIAKSDNDRGFWWSPSNIEVFGITSLDSPVDFQLGDVTSLANILNEGKVSTFIRQGGFRAWGNLTGSIDAKYQFVSVRRTADIINDSILRAHLWAVDRNITKTYLADVAESVNGYLASLKNQGAILGGRCWPDPDLNSPANIALGKVFFNFEFTPPYPAQTVTFRSILTNDYLSELI